ncbi:inositol monophosphatase family protein [Isobaculum melis]|uniref:inositol-phosphate phosphatase n=1 Tax=Isobaculum melis TaxID=142588 RepID=A0A1H9RRG2_9LACT|nr:inositol monophosphatase family protein [Isobaculum melis]SER75561.1 myo-inositol-1(or 4)-monophosphatase [Isobaculum melis]
MDWEALMSHTKEWVIEAGEMIRSMSEKSIEVSTKVDDNDLVTNVDRAVEEFLVNKIRTQYPEHHIVGEEGYGDDIDSVEGIVWMIDPIDGTKNFVHLQRHFAISVGIYEGNIGQIGVIYDVMNDDLYLAKRGMGAYLNDTRMLPLKFRVPITRSLLSVHIKHLMKNRFNLLSIVDQARGYRNIGCSAIELAYVASGRLDGFISPPISMWDIAAGRIILEEVGGKLTQINGCPIASQGKWRTSIIAANPYLYDELLFEMQQTAIV